jgi:hypothetical protein
MLRLSVILILCISCEWLQAASATAQVNVGGCRTDLLRALRSTSVDGNHYVLNGTADEPVEIVCDDVQLFANHVELFNDENRFVAIGDVLFVSGTSRISAERLEFNTRTKTGTFYNASGTTIIRDKSQPGQFGAQEPNAFSGEKSSTRWARRSIGSFAEDSRPASSRRRAGRSPPAR